jgi:hypothetical protein
MAYPPGYTKKTPKNRWYSTTFWNDTPIPPLIMPMVDSLIDFDRRSNLENSIVALVRAGFARLWLRDNDPAANSPDPRKRPWNGVLLRQLLQTMFHGLPDLHLAIAGESYWSALAMAKWKLLAPRVRLDAYRWPQILGHDPRPPGTTV